MKWKTVLQSDASNLKILIIADVVFLWSEEERDHSACYHCTVYDSLSKVLCLIFQIKRKNNSNKHRTYLEMQSQYFTIHL